MLGSEKEAYHHSLRLHHPLRVMKLPPNDLLISLPLRRDQDMRWTNDRFSHI